MNRTIAALLIAWLVVPVSAGQIREERFCAVGELAPSFEANSLDGAKFLSSSLRGKPVVLNFWATWCTKCLAEMPAFQTISRRYHSDGVAIIGIVVDEPQPSSVRRILKRAKATYPQYIGSDNLEEEYGAECGLPLTVLIDRKGIIREVHRGSINRQALQADIDALLRLDSVADERTHPHELAQSASTTPYNFTPRHPGSHSGGPY